MGAISDNGRYVNFFVSFVWHHRPMWDGAARGHVVPPV